MCDCDKNSKDQTPKEVGEYLEARRAAGDPSGVDAKGLGSFLVPDPQAGALMHRTILIPDLTYHETMLRGLACPAFKWFPYGMTLSWDDQSIVVDARFGCDHSPCTYAPCGVGGKAYCGNPACCFCIGDFFGIKYCTGRG